jgi:molybdenum cofactor cytidylyltransferase
MIAAVVLAAGESSRMGTDKALLGYNHSTFLETILNTVAQAAIERVAVVLGHHAEEIRRSLDLRGAEVVINPNYRLGQTSSLQMGLQALENPEPKAILLCLVDHPAVSAQTVRRLCDAFIESRAPVVIPTHQGRRGHPVVIGHRLFDELKALASDAGANTVVRKYVETTQFVEVNDPGILFDIDDPESYRRLLRGKG